MLSCWLIIICFCVCFFAHYMGGGGGWGVLKQQHKSRSFCLSSGGGGEGRGGVGRYIWAGITMRQIYSSILVFLHKMWRFCTQSKSWKVCMCIVLPVPVLSVKIPHPTRMMKSLHLHCLVPILGLGWWCEEDASGRTSPSPFEEKILGDLQQSAGGSCCSWRQFQHPEVPDLRLHLCPCCHGQLQAQVCWGNVGWFMCCFCGHSAGLLRYQGGGGGVLAMGNFRRRFAEGM